MVIIIDAFSVEAPTENVISIKELTEDIYGTNYPNIILIRE